MNWLDIVLLLVIALSVFAASRKGFSREIVGLVASLVALVCGLWFYGSAGAFLMPYVSSPQVAHFAGFVLVFAGVMIAGAMLGMLIGRFVRSVGLSWFDRGLGALFGAVRGVLVSVALITAIMAFAPDLNGAGPPSAVVRSRIAPYVLEASRWMAAIAPRELKDGFRRRYEQVKSRWDEAVRRERPGKGI